MQNVPSQHIGSVVPLFGASRGGSGSGGGGTRDHQSPSYIVGNALAGDTLNVCDFLDPGDGSGIAAALTAAAARAATLNPPGTAASMQILVDVRLRTGRYTLTETLLLPARVRLFGAGERQTQVVAPNGAGGTLPWIAFQTAGAYATVEKIGFVLPELALDADYSGGFRGVVDVGHEGFTGRELLLVPDSSITITVDATSLARSLVHVTIGDPGRFLVEQVVVDFRRNDPDYDGGLCVIAAVTFGEFSPTLQTTVPALIAQVVRNVEVQGTYIEGLVRFDGIAGFTCVSVEVDGFKGRDVVAPVTFIAGSDTDPVYTTGPRIRNVDNIYPVGLAEFVAGVSVACLDEGPQCVITGVVISDVTGKYGGVAPRLTPITHPQIAAYGPNSFIRDVMISSMEYVDQTSDPCEAQIGSTGAGTVTNVSAARLRVDSPVGRVVIGSAGGSVENTQVTNALCADLDVLASSTNAQVLASRITNAYSDAGTGTSVSINIIGP